MCGVLCMKYVRICVLGASHGSPTYLQQPLLPAGLQHAAMLVAQHMAFRHLFELLHDCAWYNNINTMFAQLVGGFAGLDFVTDAVGSCPIRCLEYSSKHLCACYLLQHVIASTHVACTACSQRRMAVLYCMRSVFLCFLLLNKHQVCYSHVVPQACATLLLKSLSMPAYAHEFHVVKLWCQ